MSKSRKPVNRGFRFDILLTQLDPTPWRWVLYDKYGDEVCRSAKMFKRQHEAGKDCWKVQEGLVGYVQTFVNGKELVR